jgi:hypothetical protein
MDFYNYLDQDFSSQPYLFTFCASKLASKWPKVWEIQIFSKSLDKNLDYLEKAWLSQFILISLDDLDKNLDTAKSRLKSLDFKNLDREKKNSGLDMMDNLNGFQKLVSTRRTISIAIGLDCRDPQPYKYH